MEQRILTALGQLAVSVTGASVAPRMQKIQYAALIRMARLLGGIRPIAQRNLALTRQKIF